MLRTLTAIRYVTPLREGGSLPAIVEADDNQLYVLNFRGAGQGRKALIAELIAGDVDLEEVKQHLEAIPRICAGGNAAGSLGELSQLERFRRLTSPRNTIIQMSPVHSGLTDDPAAMLEHLLPTMVLVSTPAKRK
jgi:hypothetical protein